MRNVFITGGTGFMGRALIPRLIERGHAVRALVRRGSENKLPAGCAAISGDPLRVETVREQVAPADTFVHLVGAPSPNPSKVKEFREIDVGSARAALKAAVGARVQHFIYLSVAQPAPMMQAYIAMRAECEQMVRASGLNATFVRPWYVLGPGRRWPLFLKPFYWIAERVPSTREGAVRLGLVTREQMTATLLHAVENPPSGVRIVETQQIRRGGA